MNDNKTDILTKGLPEIVLNGETYKGRIIGTLDGFNIIVEGAPHFEPDTHVNIESPDAKTKILRYAQDDIAASREELKYLCRRVTCHTTLTYFHAITFVGCRQRATKTHQQCA